MSCRRGCDSGVANMELVVKDLIRQMIEDGRLQEGLKDCDGNRLRRDWQVLTCDVLSASICKLMEDGLLCFATPNSLVLDGDKNLCLLMSDGSRICTQIGLTDTYTDNVTLTGTVIKFTRTDGSSYKVDIAQALDNITATAVTNRDGSYTITGTDGKSITIPQAKAVENDDGTVKLSGNDGISVTIKQPQSGKGVAVGGDGKINVKTDGKTVRTNARGELEVVSAGEEVTVTNAFGNKAVFLGRVAG